jgi:hypothetical protein
MALAAFAGTDDIWAEFEGKWDDILHSHVPRAEYIHMKELHPRMKGFDWKLGWTEKNTWELVFKCLMYMQHLDKQRFRMFYCAIDLEAWRKLKAETYQLPDPIELCNTFCSEMVMRWYLVRYPDVLNPMSAAIHYFFDKDEAFKQPFEDKWNHETRNIDATKGDWSIWSMVKEVASVKMQDVPGIQAADILAWSINRENTAKGDVPGRLLSEIMRTVIPSGHIVWDETKMREKFSPLIYKP